MMTTQNILERLHQAINAQEWGVCIETCFQILYGLPVELQLELSCVMVARYLPIFEHRFPDCQWPRMIVNNLRVFDDYEAIDMPGDSEEIEMNMADRIFEDSIHGLSCAYYDKEKPSRVTQSCMYTICSAIHARCSNVWLVDEPEYVKIWEEGAFSEHIIPNMIAPHNNVAVIAVKLREWKEILAWFLQKNVKEYAINIHERAMQQALDEWIEIDMMLPAPEEME